MTRADDASKLARLGFRIFPLRPNSKIPPAGLHWKEAASSDPEKAFKLWSNGHADCNIGIRTGQGLVVLDFDVRERTGLVDLATMEALHDLPRSYRVRTPSGGIHVYLSVGPEETYANAVGTVSGFPGMDVRADGGYVAGPYSVTPEGVYEPLGGEIEPAPASVLALLRQRTERSVDAGKPVVELDQPDAIARAVKYLQQEAPTSTEGDGGDDTAYRVACRVLDFGLSQGAALDAMHEHWNDRCSPPWSDRELRTKVRNAAAYRHEPIGSASPAADFEPVPQGPTDAEPDSVVGQSRFPLEQISHLRQLPTPKWLVRNWLPENAVGILYGKWGSGKTFIAFDIALHLAYGFPDWHGAALPEGGRDVLVLAREGHQGFLQRIEAFQRHHGLAEDTDRLHFMRAPITFMNKGDFEALQKELAGSGKQFGLVIVDTVARVLPGADMATPENITLFMERCSRLGSTLNATVIGVHHENKTGTIMGSTFFEANSDFVYQVSRQDAEGRSLSRGRITCTKMKDGPDQWWRDLRFATVATAPQGSPPAGVDGSGGVDSLDTLDGLPEAASGSLVLSSVVEPVSARRVSAAAREPMDDAALEDAVLRMILEEGLDVSPHKQARKSGRYAPVVIGKLLGLKAGAAEELVERMTQGGRLVVENGRNGAKLVAGFV